MRIITGSARGTKLETLEGLETRPTTERVKEAVFSMIQFDIEGRRVLDLFGGSGQMGLEALSRGAQVCTFVDRNPQAVAVIKRNAQKTHLYEKCRVLNADWASFVRGLRGEQFDVVILDPPYASDLILPALKKLCEVNALADHCLIVCETGEPLDICIDGLTVRRQNHYSKVYISVLEKECAPEI